MKGRERERERERGILTAPMWLARVGEFFPASFLARAMGVKNMCT